MGNASRRHARPNLRRGTRAVVALASAVALGTGVVAPTSAAADDTLVEQILENCVPPSTLTVVFVADATLGTLVVNCDATLDLNGHQVGVESISVSPGVQLTITSTLDDGTLTTQLDPGDGVAGIQTTGATLLVTGRASVEAFCGDGAAAVGGADGAAGGTTVVEDEAALTADCAAGGGAGVGGGDGGDGGEITVRDSATLTAAGGAFAAGVGGGRLGDGGDVTIQDEAAVTATGGARGAGIGSGSGSIDAGEVTVSHDAVVTATGGEGAAGVGGGYASDGGTTVITGNALVTATGGSNGGPGIGSGADSDADNDTTLTSTTISGNAVVTAAGVGGGAGIGGGSDVDGHDVVIEDSATVTATGGDGAAGIGGGDSGGDGGETTVEGGTVTATGGPGGAGIGGGGSGDGGDTIIEGGTVTAIPDDGGAPTGASADAVGAGGGKTAHRNLWIRGGTLVLPSGVQRVHATSDSGHVTVPVYEIGPGGTVTGGATGSARLEGDGILDNQGALTLPTDMVGSTLVSTHHYEVTFDLNGAGGTAPDPVKVFAPSFDAGDRDLPADPTRAGHTFQGWNTAPNGSGTAITASSTLPGTSSTGTAVPVTAYAVWASDTPPPPPTRPVPAPTLTNTTSPDRGTDAPQVGDELAIASPASGIDYTWQRHEAGSDTWIDVRTETAYRLTPEDLGSRIRVRAVATALPYVGTATSAATGQVQAAPLPDPALTVTGAPRIGQTLTAIATLPDIAGLTTTWTWHTRAPGAEEWTAAPGAGNTADYVPTAETVGHDVRVTLALTAPGHQDRTDTAGIGPVVDRPALTKSRAPRVGKALRVAAPLPGTTHTYQWQHTRKGPAIPGDGASKWIDIPGATGRAYTPEPGDRKRRLRVRVTTSAPGHDPHTATTPATKRVRKGVLPKPDKAIEIRGKQRVNKTLQLTAIGSYRQQLPKGGKISFAWYADSEAIPRATRPKLKVRRNLVDVELHATVTATAPGYRSRTLTIRID